MPRILTNNEALRASVSATQRARYADGKPIERVRPLEAEKPPEKLDPMPQLVAELKDTLRKLTEHLAKGPVQSPAPMVNTDALVDLLTQVVANTEPRQGPAPMPAPEKVRFRVLERDEKGRVLTFEVESK